MASLLPFFFIACGSSRQLSSLSELAHEKTEKSPYRISPGDQLAIQFPYHAELNTEVWVRPDGVIALQEIGEIKAAGLTAAALDSLLEAQYNGTLVDPELNVTLKSSVKQKVFVGGEVQSPKMVPYDDALTLAGAIFEAGGFKNSAKTSEVMVLRHDPQQGVVSMKINLKSALKGENPDLNMALGPYDVVYVPKSGIAKANLATEQFVESLLPTRTLTGFGYLFYLMNR